MHMQGPTHEVRLKVLGLAGIIADQTKGKNVGKNKEFPRPPKNMRAVIAVARGRKIKATSALSKPLARSPGNDVIVSSGGDVESQATGDKGTGTGTDTDKGTKHRHLAVWASEDEFSLGTMVTFETSLDQLDFGESHDSMAQFIPKSFEITVALTEDTDHERKVALPVGIANLTIAGVQGQGTIIDLPILNLKQANPVEPDENGLGGFQMISINEKVFQSRKKKRGLGRLLNRKNSTKQQQVPSVANRKLFSSVYSIDANGDAILRVQVEVLEKGLPSPPPAQAPTFNMDSDLMKAEPAPGVVTNTSLNTLNRPDSDTSLNTLNRPDTGDIISSNISVASMSESLKSGDITKDSRDTATTQSSGSASVFNNVDSSVTNETFEHTVGKGDSSETRRPSSNESQERSNVDNKHQSSEPHVVSSTTPEVNPNVMNLFGRHLQIPTCGPMDYPDDMTHVTGDFFGGEFPIPLCAAVKSRLDEEDTFAGTLEEYTFAGTLDMNDTFSTCSDQQNGRPDQTISLLNDFYIESKALARDAAGPGSVNSPEPTPDDEESSCALLSGDFSKSSHPLPLILGASKATLESTPTVSPDFPFRVAESTQSKDTKRMRGLDDPKKNHSFGKRPQSMTASIAAILSCTSRSTVDDRDSTFTPLPSSKVPIPDDLKITGDLNSLGELTANSGQDHRQRKRTSTVVRHIKRNIPLPIALGGSGICINMHLVDDAEFVGTIEKPDSDSGESVALSESSSHNENYFEDYDNYSLYRPRSRESVHSVRRALT